MKLVLLVGSIINKFVSMHGHMNVKFEYEALKNLLLQNGLKYSIEYM